MGKTTRKSHRFAGLSEDRHIHRQAVRKLGTCQWTGVETLPVSKAERRATADRVLAEDRPEYRHLHPEVAWWAIFSMTAKRRRVPFDGRGLEAIKQEVADTARQEYRRGHRDGHHRVRLPDDVGTLANKSLRRRMRSRISELEKDPELWDDGFDGAAIRRRFWDPFY